MNDSLLYFPYIDIPKNDWTVKSILYWDNVGIIVPPNYVDEPSQYKKSTIELLQTDLVQQIFPGEYIRKVKKFDESFIKLLDQPRFNLPKRRQRFKEGKFSRINVQKFGDKIMNYLVGLKIAAREDWQWFYVENKTAKLLMLYLATVIGKVGQFTPASDKIRNLDLSLSQTGYSPRINYIRETLIEDLIPYPIAPDLTKLRRFKDKYHEELRSFRILLEQAVLEVSLFKKTSKQSKKQKLVIAEINDKKEKILRELKQSKFLQLTFGTVCGLTGAAVGFATENNAWGLFSLANAAYSSLQGYDDRPTLKDFSYLALIDNELKRKLPG